MMIDEWSAKLDWSGGGDIGKGPRYEYESARFLGCKRHGRCGLGGQRRHGRIGAALEHAQAAELEPGDAVYIPAMWWHNVEALEDFNILINHWWREGPAYMGAPQDALLHAIMNIRPLRAVERAAWRAHFEHYVFDADPSRFEHIPASGRGVLGELGEADVARIRALLRKNLNR